MLLRVTDTGLPPSETTTAAPASTPVPTEALRQPSGLREFRAPKSLLRFVVDVLLIGMGVFLGLMGEQWRERSQHRELAESSLRRLRTELASNRAAVARVKDYHITKKADIDRYFAAPPQERVNVGVQIAGLRNVFFERTAWDLALVTESLAYMDPQIASSLSQIYTLQQDYADLTRGVMQALYLHPPTENVVQFLGAVSGYFGDIVLWEPQLLKLYDDLIPRIDQALGDTPAE